MSTSVLSVRNLSLGLAYNDDTLVHNLSFDIQAGEVLALVGESGSGKSLTALAITRLLDEAIEVRSGSVLLNGENLFQRTEQAMNTIRGQKIAMIFQEPQSALNPMQTIAQQLSEVLALHQPEQNTQSRLIELLDEVGIPDPEQRLNWYPHQLSGGQKQRVMIAMALACQPDVLIADEPTTALDVTIQKQILTLLNTLRESYQLSILLITHDMSVVAEMADQVVVMRHGKQLETANRQTFFQQPEHEYSRQLIHALPKQSEFLAEPESDELLSVHQLRVWFPMKRGVLQRTVGYTKAVDDISFSIKEGETLALVGESGSGKTTAGKAILGLNPIHDGKIHFQQDLISQLSKKSFLPYRKNIQVIFQDPFSSMNPRMTIREILEEGMKSLKVESNIEAREAQLIELLERVGMQADHLNRYPHEFSGGQRQRIAIARALAVKPKLIICDEPTSALDVSIRGQVLALLKELQQEMGLSYLFITHDLSIIPHLAHRVAVMKNGEIVEQGKTEQIMTQPQHEYTKTLLAAAPRIQS